ncbi:MAG: beta-ketoacyl-[acyl-carrier-protein] synthase II [Chloroflexi bacterium AL-W]|nr:beta-ketoacyl-[acyl-carrier-protein] synthase II [Chloroflexi bacterium AL-N1]NOK66275.1 beta-ketoacyl-[acyl-carrier-protein] synthase II [Chloroflexi bacterium AL-N10]NOK73155.1 beta-ketoacyl-[acyl-carrier-protein] synthase II [Chloroflexi bacterium AL-N5]NOK80052.1 beta-ketoacyl-[acyl-carrier-protein] synthase II [Chloroflexi bacterium AL-W]NOK88093.1 beta-ketoacyl-[acyl-carrier-protein] synthase II [Chloroflexi bacterium AL-N15]
MRRVVVTGLGAITPVGNDVPTMWRALLAGQSGIQTITRFDAGALPIRIAGEVNNFTLDAAVDAREARRMSLYVQYALNATLEAVRAAQLDMNLVDREQVGVVFGTGAGGLDLIFEQHKTYLERGHRRVAPTLIANMVGDSASGYIAIQLGAKGPNMAIMAACSTGGHNIGEGFEIVRRGDAEVIIAGSSEAPIHPTIMASFTNMRGLDSDNEHPEKACKPFDVRRNGFILAEGAGALVLESLEHAQARHAPIIAEVLGHGSSNDAIDMVAADQDGHGAARAMQMALRKAGIAPADVDYINAHGTGTPLNDRSETLAIKTTFGTHASKLAISSTKSMLGHMMGAAGAVEAIICALAIRDGYIPPTINLAQADPACDLDYVPNTMREAPIRVALSNSIGLGGHNSALVLRRYSPT